MTKEKERVAADSFNMLRLSHASQADERKEIEKLRLELEKSKQDNSDTNSKLLETTLREAKNSAEITKLNKDLDEAKTKCKENAKKSVDELQKVNSDNRS